MQSSTLQISNHLRSFHFPDLVSFSMKFHFLVCFAVANACLTSVNAIAGEPQTVKLAHNVYGLIGTGGTVTRENRGRVANAGFIVGPTGVVVVDTGVSYRHGRQLREAISAVTDRPVKLVILTHAVREFVFGARAFEEFGVTIAAHRETLDLMKARCAHCLEQLNEQLGAELDGTRLVLPTRLFDDSIEISMGGVELDIIYSGWASTPGDVAVFHKQTGTLFAGGIVTTRHVPTIRDGDFDGWKNALGRLGRLSVRQVVPGFGPPAGPEAIAATATYLDALDARVSALYAETSSLLETIERSDLPAYADWLAYDQNHRRNALHRQLQLEIEDLGGDPRSTALPGDSP
jgi:glyoxylase-like metal-dependent hydrolase (beta-lactamase superfamily II)